MKFLSFYWSNELDFLFYRRNFTNGLLDKKKKELEYPLLILLPTCRFCPLKYYLVCVYACATQFVFRLIIPLLNLPFV